MRILLTGRDGQIGSELARMLRVLGHVIAPPRAELDLARPDSIVHAIRHTNPHLIINAAGYTKVDLAESQPDLAFAVNAHACHVLAEQAHQRGCPLVHFSTDYVFDGNADSPYLPHANAAPINVYGRSKRAGEEAILDSGASALILRTSWVYSFTGQNFLNTMLRLADERSVIRVVDDQTGTPTWSRTVARATMAIIQAALVDDVNGRSFQHHAGIHHVASLGQTTWCRFAQRIFALANLPSPPLVEPITSDQFPAVATRPAYSVLECHDTIAMFGVTLPPWEDALAEAFASRAGNRLLSPQLEGRDA